METNEFIRERIAQIIGEASMLWSEIPQGVFQSEKAIELVDEIMKYVSPQSGDEVTKE